MGHCDAHCASLLAGFILKVRNRKKKKHVKSWIHSKSNKSIFALLVRSIRPHLLLCRLCHYWLHVLEDASLLEASQHVFHLSQTTATVASLRRKRHQTSSDQLKLYRQGIKMKLNQGVYLWKWLPPQSVLWAGLSDKRQWSAPTWRRSCPAESQSVDSLHPERRQTK